ncbi:MAG TPA: plastocyanin/azurin family copper-binding protein [Ktedonobacteraceae bacterium]
MRNRTVWFFVAIVLVCVLALMGTGLVVAAAHGGLRAGTTAQDKPVFGATHVYMRREAYSPASIQVVFGTTVTWTNQDTVPHTVILSPVVISSSDNWESGLLSPGQSFSYTFTSRGTFKYYCSQHPSEMIGTVIVT